MIVHIPWVLKRSKVSLVEKQVLRHINASIAVLEAQTVELWSDHKISSYLKDEIEYLKFYVPENSSP